jgi:hypothetical protein
LTILPPPSLPPFGSLTKSLEDGTIAPGTHLGNILICVPTHTLHLISGTIFPTHAEAALLATSRPTWTELRTKALTASPPRCIWLAGPDRGPRGIRARALARQGAISPLGNIIDNTMPPRIPDPWKQEDPSCYACWEPFSDMLPDPHSAHSRTTPFDCHIGKRHGICWDCCTHIRAVAPPLRVTCGICRCEPDPDDTPQT